MSTDKRKLLQEHFKSEDVKYRIMQGGKTQKGIWAKALKYIDARLVEKRLDDVFGWDNWEQSYQDISFIDNKGKQCTGFICTIKVTVGDKVIYKQNGADLTDVESFKGGLSDSFKRCASSGFGIGRELYDEKEEFVECSTKKDNYFTEYAKLKDNTVFYWHIPGSKSKKEKTQDKIQDKTIEYNDNNKNIGPGGQKYITTDTNKKVSEKQLQRMFAISQKTLLTDEEIKADIKERYNYNSRNDFKKNQYDEYVDYLETLITKNEEISLRKLMSNKGKTDEDLNFVLQKANLKGIGYLTKKDLKDLTERLNKLPDVEGLPI
jgi:hypothetical protein